MYISNTKINTNLFQTLLMSALRRKAESIGP